MHRAKLAGLLAGSGYFYLVTGRTVPPSGFCHASEWRYQTCMPAFRKDVPEADSSNCLHVFLKICNLVFRGIAVWLYVYVTNFRNARRM
ncbi:hypothetical protein EV421DRAFT_755446 [Armillaria borealis]|uniref:Secreted protein n=1 Tax=Armillaria borealis TaxID=47425 RepID=A0AA39M5Q4_9AGAR|nr:hypothetical protein EV421DRAFT_755446 [Armillaria borealis]